MPVAKGKRTLKISRRGPLPNIAALRLDSSTGFPEGWEQPERKVDLARVPPRFRSAFLPPDAVNVAALMEAHAAPGQIVLSESLCARVRNEFDTALRDEVETAKKGRIRCHVLNGPKS